MKYISDTTRIAVLLAVGFFSATTSQAQTFLTNGLVAYYPFNGNANDASGNGNNGTVYGATLTPDRFGNPNAAYYFNGTNSYIDIPQNSVLNSLTTNFTLSAWIWQQSAKPDGYRILDKNTAGEPAGWTLDTDGCNGNPGDGLRLQGAYVETASACDVSGQTAYSLMQWHHVVATVSGTNGWVYLDGTLDGSGIVGNIPVNTLDVFIGLAHPGRGSGFWFNGDIDDVRIYNVTLSSNEVAQLYAYESGPILNIQKAVYLTVINLWPGSNYQVQASSDLINWTNQGSVFTATTNYWRSTNYWDVENWNDLFFRLQVSP
jgi:hypothetical protein